MFASLLNRVQRFPFRPRAILLATAFVVGLYPVLPSAAVNQAAAQFKKKEPEIGRKKLDFDRPGDAMNAIISLKFVPPYPYPGDRVTVHWEVKDPRPGVAWAKPVSLKSSVRIDWPSPAPKKGSHTFTAPETTRTETITLETGGNRKTVEFTVARRPVLTTINLERAKPGDVVTLRGRDFGSHQIETVVNLLAGNQALVMPIESWRDDQIRARVPNNAPTGAARIRVNRGQGRLLSAERALRIYKKVTITDEQVRAWAKLLDLGQTSIRLHHGDNASSIKFGAAMKQLGAGDVAFTIPKVTVGSAVKARYWVNDMNSSAIGIGIANGQIVLTVAFESKGTEIRGTLVTFLGNVDEAAPDIQLNKASVALRFTPGRSGDNLVFTSGSAKFDADVQIGADWLDDVIQRARNAHGELRGNIEDRLSLAANSAAVRSALASAVRGGLRDLGISKVLSVSAAGASLTIEYE